MVKFGIKKVERTTIWNGGSTPFREKFIHGVSWSTVQCIYMLSDERLQYSKHGVFSDGAQGTKFDSVYENKTWYYLKIYITCIGSCIWHKFLPIKLVDAIYINFEVIMHALTCIAGWCMIRHALPCFVVLSLHSNCRSMIRQDSHPLPPIWSGSCNKAHGVGAARR